MKMNPFSDTLLSALILLLASCQKEGRIEIEENSLTIPAKSKTAESSLLKSVRQATSRFHSTTQAIAAGYEPDDHCVLGFCEKDFWNIRYNTCRKKQNTKRIDST